MGKKSREEDILELFYNYPTKHWHFKEIRKEVGIADNKISRWLKLFINKGLIKKIKPTQKMPYYVSNYGSSEYQNRKKIYAIEKLHRSGLLNHLTELDAKTVIIFGSFVRWDWNSESDIDLFIFGDDKNLEKGKYEKILHRDCDNPKGVYASY
jgi:hypothetical protein